MDDKKIKEVAEWIVKKKYGVVFTGAGISTESGIPDFRSPNGIWQKYNIEEYATIDAFLQNPQKVWEFFLLREKEFRKAQPNPGHLAITELQKMGKVRGVITQNIDTLHQRAGSQNVLELHGSVAFVSCLNCRKKKAREKEETIPYCECGAIMKPDVVLFGEPLPDKVFRQSVQMALEADFMLVLGTSGFVYPAAQIPFMAKRNQCFIIEINQTQTSFSNSITDIFIQGKTGEILPQIVQQIQERM